MSLVLDPADFIPLKRNQACKECKRRKIKCDGNRPVCLPCLRRYQQARRLAGSKSSSFPDVECSWPAEPGEDHSTGRSHGSDGGSSEPMVGMEQDREALLARIAELETRLESVSLPGSTGFMTSTRSTGVDASTIIQPNPFPNVDAWVALPPDPVALDVGFDGPVLGDQPGQSVMPLPIDIDVGFGDLFMVPNHWPRNLPAPYILEHLIETFFSCVPRLPRLLHRATILRRIHLPPHHPQFPLPALLHAICAAAASHTAWVSSLPVTSVYATVSKIYETGKTLEDIEDFALAQAEACRRGIHESDHKLWLLQGDWAHQTMQAQAICVDVWFDRMLFGAGWICLGDANRYVRQLEIANRTKRPGFLGDSIVPPPTDVSREERLAAGWSLFMHEAFVAIGRLWPITLDDRYMYCRLPADGRRFQSAVDFIEDNPQTATDTDLFTVHPVDDPFVLLCKVSLLCARVVRVDRDWAQREAQPGDKMSGMDRSGFKEVVRDILDLQRTMPDPIKNVLRVADQSSDRPIDANIIAVHIMPHIALMMLHEPFVDWDQPDTGGLPQMVQAVEAVLGILHLIPTNFDVGLILTIDLAYNIQVCAQFLNVFIDQAVKRQAYARAMRYRADFNAIKDLLKRYGQKHGVGSLCAAVLDGTLQWQVEGHSMSENHTPVNERDQNASTEPEQGPASGYVYASTFGEDFAGGHPTHGPSSTIASAGPPFAVGQHPVEPVADSAISYTSISGMNFGFNYAQADGESIAGYATEGI